MFFFFNDTAPTEIYTLSLHDALPIWWIEQERKLQTSAQKELGRDASTAKFRKDSSYVELVELAKLDSKQIELFGDDGRSCFCHD